MKNNFEQITIDRHEVIAARRGRLNSEAKVVDSKRMRRMKGHVPMVANIDDNIERAFNIIDLILWIIDLIGAFLDLMRDFGDYLLGE